MVRHVTHQDQLTPNQPNDQQQDQQQQQQQGGGDTGSHTTRTTDDAQPQVSTPRQLRHSLTEGGGVRRNSYRALSHSSKSLPPAVVNGLWSQRGSEGVQDVGKEEEEGGPVCYHELELKHVFDPLNKE